MYVCKYIYLSIYLSIYHCYMHTSSGGSCGHPFVAVQLPVPLLCTLSFYNLHFVWQLTWNARTDMAQRKISKARDCVHDEVCQAQKWSGNDGPQVIHHFLICFNRGIELFPSLIALNILQVQGVETPSQVRYVGYVWGLFECQCRPYWLSVFWMDEHGINEHCDSPSIYQSKSDHQLMNNYGGSIQMVRWSAFPDRKEWNTILQLSIWNVVALASTPRVLEPLPLVTLATLLRGWKAVAGASCAEVSVHRVCPRQMTPFQHDHGGFWFGWDPWDHFSRMRSKGSRFTLGVWELLCSPDVAQPCATVRNRPQRFATVRVRAIWPCLW